MSLDNTPPDEERPEEFPPDDNQFEEFRSQYDDEIPPEEEKPVSNGNRGFLRLIGIIGSIIVLLILAIAGYFIISRSQLAQRFQQQAAQVNFEETTVALTATGSAQQAVQAMTQKAILPATWTPTPKNGDAQATATPLPANTTAPTASGPSEAEIRTATVAAFLTQSAQGGAIGTPVAQATTAASPTARPSATSQPSATARSTSAAQATATPRSSATPLKTATALPETGFADEVGLPGMLGLALALMIVVFAARRIRLSISQ